MRRKNSAQLSLCIKGPPVIEEQTSTIVLYPGQRATVD